MILSVRLLLFLTFLFLMETKAFCQAIFPELLIASNTHDWKQVDLHSYQYLFDSNDIEKEIALVRRGGHPWRKDPSETILVSTGLGLLSTERVEILNSDSAREKAEFTMNYMGTKFRATILLKSDCYFPLEIEFASSQSLYTYLVPNQSVVGILEREVFPGPPNYQSVAQGDSEEDYWILHLKNPIGLLPLDEVNIKETDQIEIQLVMNEHQYSEFRNLLGKEVVVKGELFHGISGHHKTKVLIEVNDMQKKS